MHADVHVLASAYTTYTLPSKEAAHVAHCAVTVKTYHLYCNPPISIYFFGTTWSSEAGELRTFQNTRRTKENIRLIPRRFPGNARKREELINYDSVCSFSRIRRLLILKKEKSEFEVYPFPSTIRKTSYS